jgi:hypothetical protein
MSHEIEVKAEVSKFVRNGIKNIKELSAEELVQDAAINPFLVKALGIDDFDSLAMFYVYQRVGRSLVTSYGTTIENVIRALSGGEKPVWWDVKTTKQGKTYYLSVKSGPRDMDKDQVRHFASQARELANKDPSAIPVIAMGYGKVPLGPIVHTLRSEGLDPNKNTLTGKRLYETITGEADYHKKLLQMTREAAIQTMSGKKIIETIEDKVKEIALAFKKKYKSVDELLLDTF